MELLAKEPHRTAVRDEWLRADLEANLHIPLTFFGKSFFTAEALTRDPNFDAKEFALSEWNHEQLSRIRTAMDRAHASYDVQSRSTALGVLNISDKKLRGLWNTTKGSALYQMIVFACIIPPKEIDIPIDKYGYLNKPTDLSHKNFEIIGEELNQIVKANRLQVKLHAIFASGVEALKSEKGRRMTKEYRIQHSNRRYRAPDSEKSNNGNMITPEKFRNFLIDSISASNPDIASKISHRTIVV